MSLPLVQFKAIRQNLLTQLEKHTEKELLIIPKGFSNHLYWNIAHCVVTQQLLVYHLSGNEMLIDSFWIDNFKKGTTPISKSNYSKNELLTIFHLTTEEFEKDFNLKKFNKYNAYATSFGLSLNSPEEAILFNNMHESLHYGYCLALKKCI